MKRDFILGDCMDPKIGLPSYPDKYFDLAIVDPEYGIDVANMNMGLGTSPKASKAKNRKWIAKDWDKKQPNSNYFKELFRVTKNQIIWGGNYFDLPPCYGFIIWDKDIPEGLSFSDFEFAWTSFRRAARRARYRVYIDKHDRFHPTQKPVALYRWLLENYAKPGQIILDTHVGSASSLIACESMGFDYVGFEIDPDYYAAAKNRMSKGVQLVIQ